VALALLRLGVHRLTVVDVVLERAQRLAAAIRDAVVAADHVAIEVASAVADVEQHVASADGLVNATPVGMSGERESPLPTAMLRPGLWVADIVYRPLETELLRQARAVGCPTLHGGGMVVAQAAEAFRLITGLAPDVERMYAHFTKLTNAARAA
jgi:shikimate dehydrogenase